MDQYIGRLLDGRYEILEIIGTGGMAVVYKARCHRLNRLVAIKILKDEFAGDEEFRRRFHAEGEAVAMLSHPNIVQVYDVSSADNANYIVMELIDGISLKQYMEKKGVLNWKETLHFAMQIAKGLEHAHSRSIVHRDIKPHNVMVLKNGSVKVMDFGIARVMNKSNTLTKEALGSVHYISPEQAKGGHTDNRSDIYSLSVVMYEMMAGRPPYDGESAVSVAIQHINGGAPLPSSLNPNIPAGLEQIIMKGMSLDVRDRYASATEMLQDMEEFRKNPAIVFDYRNLLDDATRTIPVASATPPRTVAEKKAQAKTGARAPTDSLRLRQSSENSRRIAAAAAMNAAAEREAETVRRAQQRRKVQEKKRERSRVAATAVVICSAVAIIAIVIFLAALFDGDLWVNRDQDLVQVPYLEGKVYTNDMDALYPDFTIRLQPQAYSSSYADGQIMAQMPVGGSRVQKGTELWITISMGPEPPVKYMDNFVDIDVEQAESVLVGQGFDVLIRKEVSYIYEAGQVTRTDPAAGIELSPGQTVYLYVSTGPEMTVREMPNVVGMQKELAAALLDELGFDNVRVEGVESQKPENEIVYQSVEKDTEVDVTSEIIIHYSLGPDAKATEETVPPTTEAAITLPVTFSVPNLSRNYTLEICEQGKTEVLVTKEIIAGAASVTVELTGRGLVVYDFYIDGQWVEEQAVNFTNG